MVHIDLVLSQEDFELLSCILDRGSLFMYRDIYTSLDKLRRGNVSDGDPVYDYLYNKLGRIDDLLISFSDQVIRNGEWEVEKWGS